MAESLADCPRRRFEAGEDILWPPGGVVLGGVRVVEGKNEVLRTQNNHLGAARESGGVLLGNASGTRWQRVKYFLFGNTRFSQSHMMQHHVYCVAHHVVPAPPR